MTKSMFFAISLLLVAACVGCTVQTAEKEPAQKSSRWKKGSETASREKAKQQAAASDGSGKRKKAVTRDGATSRPAAYSGGSYSGGSGSYVSSGGSSFSGYSGGARSESQAVEQVGKSIREGLELGPTLVVWVFDRTESAARLVTSTLTSVQSLYGANDIAAAAGDDKLLTAVVGFDERSDFLLDPPSGDVAKIKEALSVVKTAEGSREATFATTKLVLEKYLPLRTKERREVVIALVTDEPGDDLTVLDDAATMAQKHAIPIFVIGPSVPVGKYASGPAMPNAPKAAATSDARTPAADVLESDWVSFDSNNYGGSDNYDSGLGPWGLERLCRESSGAYLAVGGFGSSVGTRIDPAVMSKLAPEYPAYKTQLANLQGNKCCAALLAAAKLPPGKTHLLNPQTFFPKGGEAEMKRVLDKAQLDAARLEPEINKIYDTLAAGEGDRAKITNPRWQVAFDTALGRAAAGKCRIDGYNAMLAALKRGKTFTNPNSNAWLLEPADTIETGSVLQKLADKARANLERVKKDYPKSPWAAVAEQELRTPLGWTWKEQ
jgi:hypothetical protein